MLCSALRHMFSRLVILCAHFWASACCPPLSASQQAAHLIALLLGNIKAPDCSPNPAWRNSSESGLRAKVSDIHVCRKQSPDRLPGAAVWPCSISVFQELTSHLRDNRGTALSFKISWLNFNNDIKALSNLHEAESGWLSVHWICCHFSNTFVM